VVALGRKNYLFVGLDAGGERAAALYSLIGTAKLNGIDPEAYLRDVLTCIPDHPISHIEELLPWNVVAESAETPPLAAWPIAPQSTRPCSDAHSSSGSGSDSHRGDFWNTSPIHDAGVLECQATTRLCAPIAKVISA
jgi:IS66 C-terminal element